MRFGGNDLRKAYYDCLTNNIIVGGQAMKCFDTVAPEFEVKPYILLSTYNQTGNNNSKSKFGCNATMIVEVIDSFDGAAFSRLKVDTISNRVLELIRPDLINKGLSLTNFNVISVNLEGTNEIFLEQEEEQVFRNVMIFEHILTEK